jgi:hypothetical protein
MICHSGAGAKESRSEETRTKIERLDLPGTTRLTDADL